MSGNVIYLRERLRPKTVTVTWRPGMGNPLDKLRPFATAVVLVSRELWSVALERDAALRREEETGSPEDRYLRRALSMQHTTIIETWATVRGISTVSARRELEDPILNPDT